MRLVRDDFAFVSIVCDGWSISGIAAKVTEDQLRIDWPSSTGKTGKKWPVVAPPPELRDTIEAEIIEAVACARERGA